MKNYNLLLVKNVKFTFLLLLLLKKVNLYLKTFIVKNFNYFDILLKSNSQTKVTLF